MKTTPTSAADVAVTAAGVLTPVAEDFDSFTTALRAGISGVRRSARSGLAEADLSEFSITDWLHRHWSHDPGLIAQATRITSSAALPAKTAVAVALAAIRDAGLTCAERDAMGLVVSGNNLALEYCAGAWERHRRRPHSIRPSHAVAHLDTDVLGVVSELTGIRAEGATVGGASASGTLAVITAARLIRSGDVTKCLVLGPANELSSVERQALRASGALAAGEDLPARALCRPFDEDRCGFVPGQGAAAVVLESADSAHARHASPWAWLDGYGQRLAGHRGTEPDSRSQATALRNALSNAGIRSSDVDYVNAHGTASVRGDAAEAAALNDVFGNRPLVNSTKPLTGHCLGSAGLIELVATIAQIRGGFVHGNPALSAPMVGAPRLAPASSEGHHIDVAVSNSVAFGGINAALVLRAAN